MVFRIYVIYPGTNNVVDTDVLRNLLFESFKNDFKSKILSPIILGISLAGAFLLVLIGITSCSTFIGKAQSVYKNMYSCGFGQKLGWLSSQKITVLITTLDCFGFDKLLWVRNAFRQSNIDLITKWTEQLYL